MKILYIDYLSPEGHKNFNQIHICSLLSLNYEIHCVFRRGYYEDILTNENNVSLLMELSDSLYKGHANGLITRIFYFFQLLRIKNKIKFSSYDAVILSSYEPISLFFANIKYPMYIVNHNTIANWDRYNIKKFFIKQLGKRHIHVVFTEEMQQRLESFNVKNVIIVPHGYNKPFSIESPNALLQSLFAIDKRINESEYIIVSCFSSHFINDALIQQIICNEEFNDFLILKNILITLKGKFGKNENIGKNIILIEQHLTDIEYKYLFSKSHIILIPYNEKFRYRTSGILFECFANNKPCLITKIESMLYYSRYFNYYPFFETISELQIQILNILIDENISKYKFLNELNPINNWKTILDKYYNKKQILHGYI
jgi:hypothetical protein